MQINSEKILSAAHNVGFDLCGIATCCKLDAGYDLFRRWLTLGYDGSLEYLRRNAEKRFAPNLLMESARTVIVCGVNYKNDSSLTPARDQQTPKIASYARLRDYHLTIKAMLLRMAETLREEYGDFQLRAFTDTAPLSEKQWAVEAGLGWIGRNSLLINPDFGSFILLGELIVDFEVDEYNHPLDVAGCANCRKCVERCPAGAITEGLGIDARKCIARLTVEKEDEAIAQPVGPDPFDGWVFACDECQSVCPYNKSTPSYSNPGFEPIFDPREISQQQWLSMTEDEFGDRFSDTPLMRAGLHRIQKNIIRMQRE